MNIRLTVTGTRDLEAKLGRLSNAMAAQHLANATLAGALVIEAGAKEKAPVRTGNLRRSIHSAIVESSATHAAAMVGTDVEYAPYLEYGTRRMSARPYLRPALDERKDQARVVIEAALRNLLSQAT